MSSESTSKADQSAAPHPTFEELKALRNIAWEGFKQRREFELRVALGLWTAIAAFTYFIFGKDVRLQGATPLACAVVVSIVLFGLHLLFISRLVRGENVDRGLADYYTNEMRRLAVTALPAKLQEKVDAYEEHTGSSYAHFFQLGLTIALCANAVLAVLWKSSSLPGR